MVVDFDKIVVEGRAGIISAAVHLADYYNRRVIILNRSQTLTVGNVCSRNARDVYKEGFIGLDRRISIHGYIEGVGLLAGRDRRTTASVLVRPARWPLKVAVVGLVNS